MPASSSNLPAVVTPMGGRFPLDAIPATAEQLSDLGFGLKATHPGGEAYLAELDARIEAQDLELRRSEAIQLRVDQALNPLFFWPLCAAICQFTMHLFS